MFLKDHLNPPKNLLDPLKDHKNIFKDQWDLLKDHQYLIQGPWDCSMDYVKSFQEFLRITRASVTSSRTPEPLQGPFGPVYRPLVFFKDS